MFVCMYVLCAIFCFQVKVKVEEICICCLVALTFGKLTNAPNALQQWCSDNNNKNNNDILVIRKYVDTYMYVYVQTLSLS